ncbi:MAG: hypothetical protein P8I61_03295 [Opitutae bacterium]|nr:hypothetical protein [Opitutae bacterium]
MRFYYITLTLFLLTLNLIAQPADVVELSSKQIAQIQNQGVAGIKAVLEESNIDLQDKGATHDLVSQIVSSQISETSTPESIAEITSRITIAIAEIALSDNDIDNNEIYLVIEATAAGASDAVIKASENLNIDVRNAVKSSSTGTSGGVIKFALENGLDAAKATSAAASGATAGAIETAVEADIDVPEIVEFASSGSVAGAIFAAVEADIDVGKYIEAAASGATEAAVEAPVVAKLNIVKFVQSAAAGSVIASIESSLEANIDENIESAVAGSTSGAIQAAAGNGPNTRVSIAPIAADLSELKRIIAIGRIDGERRAKRMPIIMTPYEDDPTIRQVSPTSRPR